MNLRASELDDSHQREADASHQLDILTTSLANSNTQVTSLEERLHNTLVSAVRHPTQIYPTKESRGQLMDPKLVKRQRTLESYAHGESFGYDQPSSPRKRT